MIVNGKSLLAATPLSPMLNHKARAHGVSHGLAEAGYDLRIKQAVSFLPNQHGVMTVAVVEKNGASYEHGRFALASTVERFHLPPDLIGVVHDKSTWARQGLSVFNTVIESGWNGWLTLELVYHGNGALHIPAGAGIAQVIFHRIEERATYSGKYQGQPDRPVPAVMEGE